MITRKAIQLFIASALALLVTACSTGSNSSPLPPTISIAFATQPVTSLTVSRTASLTAVVTNDNSNAGVRWSITCGSSACGSLSASSTPSGAATTYTAPTAVPTSNIVTITATSVADSTQSTTATITITALPTVVLGDGTYVFHLSGQDGNGPTFVAGAFTVKNSVITAGEQDFTDPNVGQTDQLVAANCTLSAAGGNIQITLATNDAQIGVNGTEVFRGTPVSSTRVLLSEFDSSAAITGSLDLQTSAAAPTGGYAFALTGWNNLTPVSQLSIGGILNFNGTSLSVANSIYDYNYGTTTGQAQTFASGSVTAPDNFGRIFISLTPTPTTTGKLSQFGFAAYITSNSQLQLVESVADSLNADLGGTALAQGSNTGKFTTASVIGASYVYGATGSDTQGPVNIGGGFAFNSDGTVSGDMAFNDLINHSGNQIQSGTYTVDPTGRVTLTGIVPQPLNIALNFQLYLDGNGNALELGVDGIQNTAGLSYLQNAPAEFAGTYAIAPQGYLNAEGLPSWGSVGPMTVNSDNISGFTDYTVQGYTPSASVPLSGTENSSEGLLTVYGLNAINFQVNSGFGYYPIDGNRILAVEVDGRAMSMMVLERTNQNVNTAH